ncbi:hypothetical protein SAMN06264364_1351 [Quadrisphaera granulorum]|uniref:Uncharacterized protein n=1 Tax=Quadrisphaera granulorum TaxID=317664 RepID=A0A315ZS44_9ACTN|nr:hypothetical protein BXY45_1351 [Quadrisphaera granulorum]SZE98652.1 hypothetical protein SAMN06264364_1351 [Quadrisphaera granulorum]
MFLEEARTGELLPSGREFLVTVQTPQRSHAL